MDVVTGLQTGLQAQLRADQLSTNEAVLEQHSHGESFDGAVLPAAVVFPESTADVRKVVRFAHAHEVAVTPVGMNSSLEGHTVPVKGGVSLDMTRMNRMLELHPEDLLAVVQPGLTYPELNEKARRSGLFFPLDPGAHASLGGMVATNASGTAAVRYGVTADYVLALEVVTPTGEVIRTGSRARKSSSGYNLTRLYCGAEGTLGVITELTLRLVGLPEAASAARVPFASAEAATHFVTDIIQAGVPVARCELLDPASMHVVNAHEGTNYPEEMTVFLEFHGNPAGIAAEAALAKELAGAHGALAFEASEGAAEREQIWHARHNMFYAAAAANPGKKSFLTDLAVPISKLPEAVGYALEQTTRENLHAYLVGHVGDGNFHLAIFYDEGELPRLEAVHHKLVEQALHLGGTVTGEHGVGLRKRRYMEAEHGEALAVMRAVKHALDPKGIMNPGKKIAD
jgi:D-lactate dehydrogenase (cytochrome)